MFRRLRARVAATPRSRRAIAPLGAIAAVALAIGLVIVTGLPGSSKGASQPSKPAGATAIQRRDLVATDTESGTLSYANSRTVHNRLSGTITQLPSAGQVIKPGGTLYKVDNAPVVLFDGTLPAYRDLSQGVGDGPDVQELKQNLVALGFDPSHQITINQTFDAATTSAVDNWQSSLGETQTGTVTLGQIVFLPGPQRITSVSSVLGSTGGSGSSGSGSGSSGSAGSGTGSAASTTVAPKTEFVSLTTSAPSSNSQAVNGAALNRAASTAACPAAGQGSGQTTTTPSSTATAKTCKQPGPGASKSTNQTLAALLALLKAETLELQKSKSAGSAGAGSTGAGAAAASGSGSGARGSSGSAAGSGSGSGSGASSSGGSGSSGSGSGSSSGSGSGSGTTAQAILGTTSTQLVVTVDLDATKQSEAIVGEAVTVQLPDGTTVDGKITQVSPVAQSSSSSSSSAASGSSSSQPSATIPVTIALSGNRPVSGLDQAAVSVNFEQQKANNVLSVPVSALLATAGGGYAVQEAAPPHRLLPVTPGLFAAGFVQISGSDIVPGLEVTDSQG